MKKKLITALALIFPAAVLLLWTGSLQYRLLTAPSMRLIVEGYDPRDIFSGHYIRLAPRFDQSDCEASVERNTCRGHRFKSSYNYYIEEDIAPQLERLIWSRSPRMKLEFAVAEGQAPLIKGFYIEGIDWHDWYNRQTAAKKPQQSTEEN